jgi:VanZ family protein
MIKLRKVAVAWGPALAWMALIFYLSSRSSLPRFGLAVPDTAVEKGGHLTAYAVLAFFCWRGVRRTPAPNHPPLWAFVVTALYGASDEWHQTFVPGRTGDVRDLIVDCIGALCSLGLAYVLTRKNLGAGSARVPAPEADATPFGKRDPEIADGM